MVETIFLAVLSVYDTTAGAPSTLYFSTGRGFVSKPTDTPANKFFEPRLIQPVSMRSSVFSSGATYGSSQLSLGELLLNNEGGGLDYILNFGFDGRDLALYVGQEDQPFSAFTPLQLLSMEQLEWNDTTISVKVRDKEFQTRVPVQSVLYAGTNVLPNGVEGVPGDLKDKPKPLLFGAPKNAAPKLVNTARLIYQLHVSGLQSIPFVYDKGIALGVGTGYASQALLEASTPTPGYFNYWLGGGLIKLGSNPAGTITSDAVEGATAADRTAAQIFKRVLLYAGVSAGNISSAAIAAFDALNSAVIGIYIGEARILSDVLDEIANSVGAWWGQDNGVFFIRLFEAPSGIPEAAFSEVEIEVDRFRRITPADVGAGLPIWRVVIGYQRNYTVQSGDNVAAALATSDRPRLGFLAEEWRTASDEDAAVLTVHPMAQQLRLDTLLSTEAAADAEATRQLLIRKVRRDRFEARINTSNPQSVTLGGVIRITLPRYQLQGGKLFRVISREFDIAANAFSLTIWG